MGRKTKLRDLVGALKDKASQSKAAQHQSLPLMNHLQNTHDASIALKCLIFVHHIIKFGSFILQDQLSVYPSNGGRNYPKLSNFRDSSNPLTWELSSWVRLYTQHLKIIYSLVGFWFFFLGSSSSTANKDKEEK
ncbi:hypothetical protein UlMin_023745 [Ulmus minor]